MPDRICPMCKNGWNRLRPGGCCVECDPLPDHAPRRFKSPASKIVFDRKTLATGDQEENGGMG
jgi:hypothetical protein